MRNLLPIFIACAAANPASAQVVLDRADPFVIQGELPKAPSLDPPADVTSVQTNTAAAADGAAPALLFVGAIRIVGLERLRPSDFAAAIEPYVGQRLDQAGQQALVAAVANAARQRGLVLASAAIEPQSLSAGVLRVRVDEGRVDAIRVVGSANRLVERTLMPLVSGGPVILDQLERRLLLAGDVAGVSLRGARLVREGMLNVLSVTVKEKRVAASIGIDNWGTRTIGPINGQADVEVRGLLVAGDTLSLIAAGTPFEFREYRLLGARQLLPLNHHGTTMEWSAIRAHSRPGGRFASRGIEGDSFSLRTEVQHPLVRRIDGGLWGGVGFALRDVEQRVRGDLLRAERAGSLAFRIAGSVRIPDGVASGTIWVTQGLGLFDGTRAGDRLASRDDGDARFTKVEARGRATMTLAGPLSLAVVAEAQFASRALLVGDEMGLGGARFGRGYDYRERSGDEGVAGSAELRLLLVDRLGPVGNLVLYGFGDGGKVWNLGKGDGRSGALFSAGGGLRAQVARRLSAGLELGVPLNDERDESGNRSPRLSFETSLRF